MNRKCTGIFALTACFLAVAVSPLSAQQYEIIDLGTLGGARSSAVAINENGIISGWATLPSGERHAVIWDANGIVDLGLPPGFIASEATAANDSGQVAAYGEGGLQADRRGYLWESGSWTPIGVLPGTNESSARDINSAGRIVGGSYVLGPGGPDLAVMWEAGVLTDLGTLGGSSSAGGINDVGQVIGSSTAYLPGGEQEWRGFLWEDGQMTALDPLPGDFRSSATDINEVGQICGFSTFSGSPPYFLEATSAVLWEDGAVIDLGGFGRSSASGLNNHGQVVGYMMATSSSPTTAVIWQDGVRQNLRDLISGGTEWVLRGARDINDAGLIVGNGLASPDDEYKRAFLLKPLIPCNEDWECDDGLFCNGLEECDSVCRNGSNPCPGQVCDEELDMCESSTCNSDGTCDLGENCNSCRNDCISYDGSQACGDGICQPGNGEDCLSCAFDCRGKQNGKPSNRYCCGADVDCTDARCNADTWICDDTQPAPYCCGDGVCDPGEYPCSCPVDCGPQYIFTEANCTDGVDNDCDSLADEADPDCCAQPGGGCYSDGDCCSGNCKKSSKFPYLGICR